MSNHLLGLRDLDAQDIELLLDRAQEMLSGEVEQQKPLQDQFVANLFFENSTRTRFSFEVAEKRLGAQVLNFQEKTSSTQKGETVYDTVKTIEAMGVKAIVIRHSENSILRELESACSLSIINAGTGCEEHPTQALLDLLTMKQEFGSLNGLKVAMIGDLQHSRVLRSNVYGLMKLGAKVLLSGPENLKPAELQTDPYLQRCQWVSMDEAVECSDVVMMLRIQVERHPSSLGMNHVQYHETYGLTEQRAASMKKHAIIMHPAPFNRDVEIASTLVEAPQSRIFKQVTNGVGIRMAVLEHACVGIPTAIL